ncbi:tRNA-specific adenosine deaminase 1 [Diorhabda carinulata]|uniref:tRNA-specific adenosine deaminase 1 n=1 Tax=Diorhabda carinulata TaxID=1163345 RepID=UPI0025A1DF87|nr:tRNA-specific adenosine deaminase 1 [Diorhabda carinulata]
MSTNIHDKVAKLSLDCFKILPKSGKPISTEWTVLSCIVQDIDGELTVVALGTGSKCIGASKMSEKGDILNDSHAEVMCRRSFLRYIYDQMSLESKIIKFNKDVSKFLLDPRVKFHFFTTMVPCGDAAIFPMYDSSELGDIVEDNEDDLNPNKRKKIDIFRTGAKCLESSDKIDPKLPGSDFHVTGVVRTKPGRGDRTLSVSCSDKLAKWLHLGVQGALLSILLDSPIYLSSFTYPSNTPFNKEALERAFYDRFGLVHFKDPYKQNKIIFGKSSVHFDFFKDDSKQPCPSSISWYLGKGKRLEVAVEGKRQGVTKKKLNNKAGRLKICKLELFKTFMDICETRKIQLKPDCDNLLLQIYFW